MLSFLLPGTVDTAWLGDPTTALPAVALIEAWKWSGLITLVYIAGLKSIPREMLEAAMIDGANAWTRFWRIRLRMLAPALTFNVAVTLADRADGLRRDRADDRRRPRRPHDDAQHRDAPAVGPVVLRPGERAQPHRRDPDRRSPPSRW